MEFIHISQREKEYGQVQLLNSQIELLTMVKRYKRFRSLRKEELTLKNEIRRRLTSLQEEIKNYEKNTPHIHAPKPIEIKKQKPIETKRRDELESEIDLLKQKISQITREI
jgi:predicted phage gp36 major capsid-like protein